MKLLYLFTFGVVLCSKESGEFETELVSTVSQTLSSTSRSLTYIETEPTETVFRYDDLPEDSRAEKLIGGVVGIIAGLINWWI